MNEKILIVDDTLGILKVLKRLLESSGFDISISNESKEALKKIDEEEFDLVILDVFMPEMDGRRVAERIRSDYGPEDLKIIFLSVAKEREIDDETMESLQIQGFIHKPFQKEDVLDNISKALSE